MGFQEEAKMIFCKAMEGLSGRYDPPKRLFWCAKIEKMPLDFQGALLLCIHFSVPSRAVYSRGVIPNRRLNSAIKWDWEEKPRL